MRGGGRYNLFVFSEALVTRSLSNKAYKLACLVVQEEMGMGTKDTLLLFWPAYVTSTDLKTMLGYFIQENQISNISDRLMQVVPQVTRSSESVSLPFYLKIISKKDIIGSSYDPKIIIRSLNNSTVEEPVTGALLPNFTRDVLMNGLKTYIDEENELGKIQELTVAGEEENDEFKQAINMQIKLNSKEFLNTLPT